MKELETIIDNYEQEFLNDLKRLIEIPSIRDLSTKRTGAPFGSAIKEVMDVFSDIAKRCGFHVEEDEGYAIHAQMGEGDRYVASLGHLDVVEIVKPEEWKSNPFTLDIRNNVLYGRGVNDDKGPLLATLYAARILKELNYEMKLPIRIIAGGAEETTWECMEHYFKTHSQPCMGFSPDGNFPIVNGEKGIACFKLSFDADEIEEVKILCDKYENWVNEHMLVRIYHNDLEKIKTYAKQAYSVILKDHYVEIEYQGIMAMSRNPQRGKNVLHMFFQDFEYYPFKGQGIQKLTDFFSTYLIDDVGKKLGVYAEDEEMGTTSVCPMSVVWNADVHELNLDIRFVKSTTIEAIQECLATYEKEYAFTLTLAKYKRLLFVEKESPLIQALQKAYEQVMDEKAEVFTKGGASYARVLDHGVAFGATFEGEDPRPHMSNENISLRSLKKAMLIYIEAFKELTSIDM